MTPVSPSADLGTQVHQLLSNQPISDPSGESLHLANVFHSSPLGQRASRAPRIERELAVMFELEGVILKGQVDLWFEDQHGRIVVDYKTDHIPHPEAYSAQLRFYALALHNSQLFLHFLRTNQVVEVLPHEQACRDLVRAWKNAKDFPLNEGAHCHRCPFYKNECPAKIPEPNS